MKIDFSHILNDLDGKPIKQNGGDLTLKDASTAALLSDYQDERPSGQEKSARYSLAAKIHGSNGLSLDLDLDEVKLIRDLIAKLYAPLVAGQVWQFLNGIKVNKKD